MTNVQEVRESPGGRKDSRFSDTKGPKILRTGKNVGDSLTKVGW